MRESLCVLQNSSPTGILLSENYRKQMRQRPGIKRITFLSGSPDKERDKAFLKHHQSEGTDLYAFIEKEKERGRRILEQHNQKLLSLVIEADDLANNDELTLIELRKADISLKRHLKRLKDVIYKSVSVDPDAALFATEFKVEEMDGREYTVNEGLNERIHDLYISKTPSIETCISIIETRIQYLEKQGGAEAKTAISRINKPRSILLLLHECGMLKPFYEYAESRGLKGAQMARLLSFITGYGKTSSAFRNDIPSVIYDVKNSTGEYVKNKDSINALG